MLFRFSLLALMIAMSTVTALPIDGMDRRSPVKPPAGSSKNLKKVLDVFSEGKDLIEKLHAESEHKGKLTPAFKPSSGSTPKAPTAPKLNIPPLKPLTGAVKDVENVSSDIVSDIEGKTPEGSVKVVKAPTPGLASAITSSLPKTLEGDADKI